MPTNFVIGQILMLFAARELQKGPKILWTFPLKWSLAYSLFIFVPVTGWFFYKYMAWSTVYLRPEDSISTMAGPIILSCYALGMFFGTLLAQSLIQLGLKKLVWGTLTLGVFWLGGMSLLTAREYSLLGSYAEYHSGAARPIFENSDFMFALNATGVLLGLPVLILAFVFYRRSSRYPL